MKFTIDIVRPNDRLLHRALAEELDSMRAKTKAENVLSTRRERGASTARLLTQKGEEWNVEKGRLKHGIDDIAVVRGRNGVHFHPPGHA